MQARTTLQEFESCCGILTLGLEEAVTMPGIITSCETDSDCRHTGQRRSPALLQPDSGEQQIDK